MRKTQKGSESKPGKGSGACPGAAEGASAEQRGRRAGPWAQATGALSALSAPALEGSDGAEKGKTVTTSVLTPFLGIPEGPGELLSTLHPRRSHRGQGHRGKGTCPRSLHE